MCAEIEHPESIGSLHVGHERKRGQTVVSGHENLREHVLIRWHRRGGDQTLAK